MESVLAALSSCPASQLLALPDVLLADVLSWSPDSATANALMNTCPAMCALRRDPAVAALLLLRCRSSSYDRALASCAAPCGGGTAAVVQQLLRQLRGGARGAEQALLPAMLAASAELGDTASVRELLAMPGRPDTHGVNDRALAAALKGEHRMGALQALLEAGALDCTLVPGYDSWPFCEAAKTAAGAAVLPLLVQYWPPRQPQLLVDGLRHALHEAFRSAVPAVVTFVLTAIDDAGGVGGAHYAKEQLVAAAVRGCPALLAAVLDHAPPSAAALSESLLMAVCASRANCVRVLLDRGAAVGAIGEYLLQAAIDRLNVDLIFSLMRVSLVTTDVEVCEMVALLLERGAAVTVAALAEQAGWEGLMIVLQRATGYAAGPS